MDESGTARRFALKYFRVGDEQSRVVEYVCASLASELGIGAPDVQLLNVTPDFLNDLRRRRIPPIGLGEATVGAHVGIAWVDGADLARAPGALMGLTNPRQPAEIIATDCYFHNYDRHDSNVIVTPAATFDRPNHKLVPFDWGASLANRPPLALFLDPLVAQTTLRESLQTGTLREAVRGPLDFGEFVPRLEHLAAATGRLRSIVEWLPAEWHVPREWKTSLLDYFLRRADVVAARLREADDSEQVFPNWQGSLAI